MASIANTLAGITSPVGGNTIATPNSGHARTPGSGVVRGEGAAAPPQMAAGGAVPRGGAPAQTRLRQPKQPKQPQQRPVSANNPPLGTPAPAPPHPGVRPPYPDARSPQPTLMPNGVPVMPPPQGFVGGLPRVPPSFTPGMTGLLGLR